MNKAQHLHSLLYAKNNQRINSHRHNDHPTVALAILLAYHYYYFLHHLHLLKLHHPLVHNKVEVLQNLTK